MRKRQGQSACVRANHEGTSPEEGRAGHLLRIAAVLVLGLAAYANTLDVPFQWDGVTRIAENAFVRNIEYFLHPGEADTQEYGKAVIRRYVGYLTFALNYRVHGKSVAGYHAVNLAIHLGNALLLYFFVLVSFRTPVLSGGRLSGRSSLAALGAALVFVAHPLQTEAVVYIFQRFASLVSFFFLLSVTAYAKFRLSGAGPGRRAWYALSVLSACCAMLTKENAFTLPVAILLYEGFFFRGDRMKRVLPLVPLMGTLLIVPALYLTSGGGDTATGALVSAGYAELSRGEYLFTQFRVIVTYARLLLLPVNQNIDYDYPLQGALFEPEVILSLLGILAAGLGAFLLFRRSVREPALRFVSYGIIWFFLTLAVESSVIPIPMLMNEYRVYLPSAGLFAAFVTAVVLLSGTMRRAYGRALVILVIGVLPLLLAGATYARNSRWETRISLWEDTVAKSPMRARAHNNLGRSYEAAGRLEEAGKEFERAVSLFPEYAEARNNLGIAHLRSGAVNEAVEQFKKALELKPDYPEARSNLGNAFMQRGQTTRAIREYRAALRLKPDYPDGHFNLGLAYLAAGSADAARRSFSEALRLRPGHAPALQFLRWLDEEEKKGGG
jgi:tetratricopeptide (TPR) repeat protein